MSTSLNRALNPDSYQPESGNDPAVPAWKLELNAKLAAHRQRRPSSAFAEPDDRMAAERRNDGSARAASVAARVAERYAKAPSYSEFLAASAAAAAAAAETAAFAARQAQEAAERFARLSAEQPQYERPGLEALPSHPVAPEEQDMGGPQRSRAFDGQERKNTVEHPEPLPPRGIIPPRPASPSYAPIVDAFAEATVPPATSLPAKLIEFPRELIATHKSRPRIAEGPLVEEAQPSSLRIFEVGDAEGTRMADGDAWRMSVGVEPAALQSEDSSAYQKRSAGKAALDSRAHATSDRPVSDRPVSDARSPEALERRAPAWPSIRLGEHPAAAPLTEEPRTGSRKAGPADKLRVPGVPVLHLASLADRAMAGLVDAVLVAAAFLLFVLVFSACTTHPPVNKSALVCAAAVWGSLFLFYEWLFVRYGGATLGMRYARIALCTFEDDNPTRTQRQRRVAASVLSATLLGLGFLWALFDEEGLGWHDRMSRSYQRSYR